MIIICTNKDESNKDKEIFLERREFEFLLPGFLLTVV